MSDNAARKFVVVDNTLIMGVVEYHLQLVSDPEKRKRIKGGGRFELRKEEGVIYFYGISTDFGQVTKEQFQEALNNSYISHGIRHCKFLFSTQLWFADALKEINAKGEDLFLCQLNS